MLGGLIGLLLPPMSWSLHRLFGRWLVTRKETKRFYRSAEWQRLRYAQLAAEPARRLDRFNLQTLCGRAPGAVGNKE